MRLIKFPKLSFNNTDTPGKAASRNVTKEGHWMVRWQFEKGVPGPCRPICQFDDNSFFAAGRILSTF